MVLYCIVINDPLNFILHSAELQIGSSIRYENALYGNYFLNCYIVKRILISFYCFSEHVDQLSRSWYPAGTCLTSKQKLFAVT